MIIVKNAIDYRNKKSCKVILPAIGFTTDVREYFLVFDFSDIYAKSRY